MSETYKGVKFKAIFKKKEFPKDNKISELKNWFKIFRDKNLAPVENGQAGGNLSFRIKNGELPFIITGTQIGLENTVDDSMFVKVLNCNFDKKIINIEGLREPSSESFLHYAIYKVRPDINAIFHGHSKEILDNFTKMGLICTKKEVPYGSIQLVNSVLEILNKNTNFLIIKNHGFLSFGKTMQKSGELTCQTLNKCLTYK